ncbi:hypothetical protein SAMD00019534_058800 [Acytostelium subglobosum LB1]|uniref:hypothetical protein n=1 Tax=Acytostelium subglobosum LB1 TaxID=1410327 RepID=UPI0006449DFF|nr:hypothetical protein SAMD00019534_058800 [Acytostelium subglobosum LB1]GAM22705.1 hypothetical protein SAMD00019534_058800 [Acytostelium subglobosum LB1]|eukprot:XP_012753932.1 hypothetical protein SAMD00019534_058800 [Acytostelium subglobosum LB1]
MCITTSKRANDKLVDVPKKESGLGPMEPLRLLWKFARPHTIIHSFLTPWTMAAVAAGGYSALATATTSTPAFAGAITLLWLAYTMANLYIVGLNQIYDVEVDRINKPNLPIASGELSESSAWKIVLAALTASVGLLSAATSDVLICVPFATLLAIGTWYSLKLGKTAGGSTGLRLKDKALTAALSIIVCRGMILPFTTLTHAFTHASGNVSAVVMAPIMTLTAMRALVIAVMKDIPDMAGDKAAGENSTLAISLGAPRVFRWCINLMCLPSLLALIAVGLNISGFTTTWNAHIVILYHVCALLYIRWQESAVDANQPSQVTRFYTKTLWIMFYVEMLLFPAMLN